MKKIFAAIAMMSACLSLQGAAPVATVAEGTLEGVVEDGVNIFRGVPFAAPPVGDLRWKAPQPAPQWEGVRKADKFGPNPMQQPVFGDMNFGTSENSEDCLYLNIWAPEVKEGEKLPVLIYFNGGGLIAGSGSEPRYAGKTMAGKGIVAVTANYREGIFGFFSHPDLSAETEYGGSGNYGLMDMAAAIQWVKDNISRFGGDPDRITIAGESAGSIAVSALMASPMSKELFAQAIGSSGSLLSPSGIPTLSQAEQIGLEKARLIGTENLDSLRMMSAAELMERSQCWGMMPVNVDGRFFTRQPLEVFEAGEQADVPLLVGGNSCEQQAPFILRGRPATLASVRENVGAMFGDNADRVLALYGIESDTDVAGNGKGVIDLASDMFLGYVTWKWADTHGRTAKSPVYRYYYTHSRPAMKIKGKKPGLAGGVVDAEGEVSTGPEAPGAVHSADIEYAMGNLATNEVFDWQEDDFRIEDIFSGYYADFVKYGNPNGKGPEVWPALNGKEVPPVLILDMDPKVETDAALQQRYEFIDSLQKR